MCGQHHAAVRTSKDSKRELIKRIGDKEKEIELSELLYIPRRKRNSGWQNIEKANRMRTAKKLDREWREAA